MANPFKQLIDWLGIEFSDNVTPRQAMTLPAVWFGVNKISGHCARLPLFIKRQLAKGGQDKAVNHWAYDKLLVQPNGYQTADIFKQQIISHGILWGNGRAAIVDEEIIPLMPDRTITLMVGGYKMHVTQPEKDDRLSLYQSLINKETKTIVFSDSEVLHIQGFTFDGIQGLSLVGQMKRSLGIPIEQEKHAYNQTQKGFVAKVMVEAPQGMFNKEADAKEWIKQFNEQHSSSENAGKAGLLRNGMKANVMSMSNSDSEFLEQRRFSRQDIGLMLGLDGLPGDGNSRSYNSKDMEALNYLDTALAPWICKMEMQVDTKIISASERRRGYFAMFDLAELLRTDAKTQAEIHSIRIAYRIQNPNQCREELGFNPYEGGDDYINPAITPSPQKTQETQPETPQNTAKPTEKTEKLVVSSLKRLFRRESRDVINGANKKDFCGWLDTYYAKWQSKLEEHFEDLELDAELAASHCKESHKLLLDIAGESTVEQLKSNVEKCVESWESRAEDLLGVDHDATQVMQRAMVDVVTAITSQKPPVVNITNQTPSNVINVEIPKQEPPVVNVTNDIHTPEVTITNDVKTPNVNVTNQVETPNVTVTNDVQPAAVDVNVNLPARKTTTTVLRDNKGAITGSEQIEEDLTGEE